MKKFHIHEDALSADLTTVFCVMIKENWCKYLIGILFYLSRKYEQDIKNTDGTFAYPKSLIHQEKK